MSRRKISSLVINDIKIDLAKNLQGTPIAIPTGPAPKFTISSGGRVGIGSTNPHMSFNVSCDSEILLTPEEQYEIELERKFATW